MIDDHPVALNQHARARPPVAVVGQHAVNQPLLDHRGDRQPQLEGEGVHHVTHVTVSVEAEGPPFGQGVGEASVLLVRLEHGPLILSQFSRARQGRVVVAAAEAQPPPLEVPLHQVGSYLVLPGRARPVHSDAEYMHAISPWAVRLSGGPASPGPGWPPRRRRRRRGPAPRWRTLKKRGLQSPNMMRLSCLLSDRVAAERGE